MGFPRPILQIVCPSLFLGMYLHNLHHDGSLSIAALATWIIVLVLYVLSIVGGRLYMGMHEFMDVSVGITLRFVGVGIATDGDA